MDPLVSIQDLQVVLGDRRILDGVTATVEPSHIRVILGKSGCGKTTLLKTIIGLIQPTSGSITLFGTQLTDPEAPGVLELFQKIGVMFQHGALLGSLTVAENIALPLHMHTSLPETIIEEIVQLKLEQVDLPHAGPLFPGEISGGMRKRVAIARAIVMDPPLVFCDEPSAGLDPVTSAGLDELLISLKETLQITFVVVTHELFSIRRIADSILFLDAGHVIFDGQLSDAVQSDHAAIASFFSARHSD
jgi:phospholipid/cholesterol/gamma-HCH transport system ATP-binding protein